MDNVIYVYIDGACRNNQEKKNLGAWGAILNFNGHEKEIGGIAENTTNNICEIMSAIIALESITSPNFPVQVISDSQYVISGINEWSKKWTSNGWKNSKKKPVENLELWKELLSLVNKFPDIKFIKTTGHSDDIENERVDLLCNELMDNYLKEKDEKKME